ncbi:hypothetical protein, partial [uncultured Propionibacterium sp.]|uniref:hypothetical protein n=1 Tax=uncultured Propionibacterium sp. TaxID=218066 RepID=UPI0029308548
MVLRASAIGSPPAATGTARPVLAFVPIGAFPRLAEKAGALLNALPLPGAADWLTDGARRLGFPQVVFGSFRGSVPR